MPLTLKQIELLTPGQRLATECPTPGKWDATRRTAYKGRSRVIEQGKWDCEVSQDSDAQTITVSVKAKAAEA